MLRGLIVLAAITFALGCGTIYRGASGCDNDVTCKAAKQIMGATHLRVYLHWRYVQPSLVVDKTMSVDKVKGNLSLIDEWANSVNWGEHDRRVALGVAANLTLIGEVGEGTVQGLPDIAGTKNRADPKALGHDVYLGYMYLTARATVRRFKSKISTWQIENEFNEAYLASFGGQRTLHMLNSPWNDWGFLTSILKTLRMAVKDEQPSGIVTQNLHSDISESQHKFSHLPGFYLDAAKEWNDLVDVWSIDSYPNYFGASPIYASDLGGKIQKMREVTGKDVFVMETGYPVVNQTGGDIPDVLNYTPARQSEFAVTAWNSVQSAGGCGIFIFTVRQTAGLPTPAGGWTQADAKFVEDLVKITHGQGGGGVLSLATLLLTHPQEVGRIEGLIDYKSAWGTMTIDGHPRAVMTDLGKAWKQQEE